MGDNDDWRLTNQEKYMFGKTLTLKKFIPTKIDHEHCEFCWQKIMDEYQPDIIKDAYATDEDYYWVCPECYNDFKEMFKWK